jgi:hypothetical protein
MVEVPSRHSREVKVQVYQYTTLATEGAGVQCHSPAGLLPAKRPGTHCSGALEPV